tara:strand:+ start:921 stop:2513 length:1593 start_codon:yes stop_codon:yes gene_type:complete
MSKKLLFSKLFFLLFNFVMSQNITLNEGGKLTVQKSGYVVIDGDFSNNSETENVNLNSDSDEFSSLIVKGNTSNGQITYNRWVNSMDNGGDLVGSPLKSQAIGEFITENSFVIDAAGSYYAFSSYNNEIDEWISFDTSSLDLFESGRGYAVATTSGATMSFKGGVEVSNNGVAYLGSNFLGNDNGGTQWILASNPYPSYIHGNSIGNDVINDFMTENSSSMDPNYVAIYGWKQLNSYNYQVFNNTNQDQLYIAPGQAFMVSIKDPTTSNPPLPPFYPQHIYFNKNMQTYIGDDDFIQGSPSVVTNELVLRLYNNETLIDYTRFYFSNDMSTGLDPGYDAGHFNQNASLMSRLVSDDNGIGFIINAINLDDALTNPIPLVVNQSAGQEFRINLHTLNIEAQDVYIEDNVLQTFTLLNDEDYIFTSSSDISGFGRYYLHMGEGTLSNNENELSSVLIYKKIGDDFINIDGLYLLSENSSVEIYDLLGRSILNKKLNLDQNNYKISTSNFSKGVYIVYLRSSGKFLKKKVIVD